MGNSTDISETQAAPIFKVVAYAKQRDPPACLALTLNVEAVFS
jgi:hypothetical protein